MLTRACVRAILMCRVVLILTERLFPFIGKFTQKRNELWHGISVFFCIFNYFIIATHGQGGSWYLSPHAWYPHMYGRLTTINYARVGTTFFTIRMHYFTKISVLECIILQKIAFLNALFYYLARFWHTTFATHRVSKLANFKKAATSRTSKMCSETYFLVSGKREKRSNLNFLPRKLAYVRINGVSLYSRSF